MAFILPEAAAQFAGDTDADLLGYVAMQADDPETAKAAFAEFYRRHVRWLYGVLIGEKSQSLLGGPERVKEFVQDTFQKAYLKAAEFDAGGVSDPVRLRNRTRAWLGRIGHHLMVDAVRAGAPAQYEFSRAELDETTPEEEAAFSPKHVVEARDMLERLPPREQDIVLEWAYHWKAGVTHQRLPNEASSRLMKNWATTQANIRAIRTRTFGKLRAELVRRCPELARRFK